MKIKVITKLEKRIINLSTVSKTDKLIMILISRGYNILELSLIIDISMPVIKYKLKKLSKNKEVYDLLH